MGLSILLDSLLRVFIFGKRFRLNSRLGYSLLRVFVLGIHSFGLSPSCRILGTYDLVTGAHAEGERGGQRGGTVRAGLS